MRDTYDFKPAPTATPERIAQLELALASIDTPRTNRRKSDPRAMEKHGASVLSAPLRPATHGGWRVRFYYWSEGGELLCTVTAPMSRIAADNCGKGVPTLRTRSIRAYYNATAPRGVRSEDRDSGDCDGREYPSLPQGRVAREVVSSHFGWARMLPGVRLVTLPSEVPHGVGSSFLGPFTASDAHTEESPYAAMAPLQVAA